MTATSIGHGYYRISQEIASASLKRPVPFTRTALVSKRGDGIIVLRGNLMISTNEIARAIAAAV